jgi:hypothetical protein
MQEEPGTRSAQLFGKEAADEESVRRRDVAESAAEAELIELIVNRIRPGADGRCSLGLKLGIENQ